MDLTIFIPCYNEEENIKLLEKELISHLKDSGIKFEILIVNDGSKDNSLKEIRKLQKKYKFIKLVDYKNNKGLGYAIKTGIKHAKGELMVTIDADYTMHPRYIKPFLERFKKGDVDCVSGSPYLFKEGLKDVQLYRKILSKGVNTIYSLILGNNITSLTPIFKIYKISDLKDLNIESNGFDAVAEILIKLILKKKSVVELPIELTKREHGVSKLNLYKETKNHLWLICRAIKWRLTIKNAQ